MWNRSSTVPHLYCLTICDWILHVHVHGMTILSCSLSIRCDTTHPVYQLWLPTHISSHCNDRRLQWLQSKNWPTFAFEHAYGRFSWLDASVCSGEKIESLRYCYRASWMNVGSNYCPCHFRCYFPDSYVFHVQHLCCPDYLWSSVMWRANCLIWTIGSGLRLVALVESCSFSYSFLFAFECLLPKRW